MHKSIEGTQERLELVRWAALIGAVTARALARRQECSLASARARLQAAERAGLLQAHRPLADHPRLYTATRRGLRAVELSQLDPVRVSAAGALHAIVCADVASAIEHAYPDHRVMGERELRRVERERGVPLASARVGHGPGGAPLLHRPDLVLWPQAGSDPRPIAVEVELTVKAARRLQAICRGWARCRCVAGVLYLAAPQVRRPLRRAIERAQADGHVAVVALEALEPRARTVPSDA